KSAPGGFVFCSASAIAPALLYLLHPCSRKESIQRKGGPIAASSCAPRFCRGSVKWASCPFTDARHSCRAPLCPAGIRAYPDKTCGARRGKREQNSVTA
ncbi:MAG: hypothetical protein PHU14_11605, partial [Methylovulum sp.]|nr:hypothetical protein [Methylovulum sp.]